MQKGSTTLRIILKSKSYKKIHSIYMYSSNYKLSKYFEKLVAIFKKRYARVSVDISNIYVDYVYSRHWPALWTCDTKETFALSRDSPLKKRAVVRYRLSRYSQPANLKSKETSCPALLFPTSSLSSRLPLYWIALDVSSPVFACISCS